MILVKCEEIARFCKRQSNPEIEENKNREKTNNTEKYCAICTKNNNTLLSWYCRN